MIIWSVPWLKFTPKIRSFRIGNEDSLYELDIGDYSGNATDAFAYHHGQKFSTKDEDNDMSSTMNCADHISGGWWYGR